MAAPFVSTGINSALSDIGKKMSFIPPLSLSSNAQSGSDGILDGLHFGGSFQVGGAGASLSGAGPQGLGTAQGQVIEANLGTLGLVAAGIFLLMMMKGKI